MAFSSMEFRVFLDVPLGHSGIPDTITLNFRSASYKDLIDAPCLKKSPERVEFLERDDWDNTALKYEGVLLEASGI